MVLKNKREQFKGMKEFGFYDYQSDSVARQTEYAYYNPNETYSDSFAVNNYYDYNYNYNNYDYNYDYSAASAVSEMPVRENPFERRRAAKEKRLREEQLRIKKEQQRERKRAVAKRRQNRLVTGYMVLGFAALAFMFVSYVSLQSQISASMKNISRMQIQLNDMKADNNAASSRIATITNLQEIKNTAIEELGMVYANTNQIVYYSKEKQDFMSQYSDIP